MMEKTTFAPVSMPLFYAGYYFYYWPIGSGWDAR
jgi:hypothetical protein